MDQRRHRRKARQSTSCPHCGDSCRKIPAPTTNPLEVVYFLQCNNLGCGGTYRAQMTILETMEPSRLSGAAATAVADHPASAEVSAEPPPAAADTRQKPVPLQMSARAKEKARAAAEVAERNRARAMLDQYMTPATRHG